MSCICYIDRKFSTASRVMINHANDIIAEYMAEGYKLTLRQLYYQFVSRDLIPNTTKSYKNLGSLINDARLAGLIDWEAIEDRTRNLSKLPEWESPQEIVAACGEQFRIDKWADQNFRVEVWIEKEALAGVFERICNQEQVPFFCCRGYTSQSEMWAAGQRLKNIVANGQDVIILHFGDHDPSGMDMSRDIEERLELFIGESIQFERLALNMPQIEQYEPPPNPAKSTDSRYQSYSDTHGDESWELDALEPAVLAALVENRVNNIRDPQRWQGMLEREEEHRRLLGVVARRWASLTKKL